MGWPKRNYRTKEPIQPTSKTLEIINLTGSATNRSQNPNNTQIK